MSRRQEERAQLIRRSLRIVEQLDGVPLLDDGGLWLLTDAPVAPSDPFGLARALTTAKLPPRQDLAGLLGARQVVRVDVENVSRWHKAVTGLERRRDIRRLIREGVSAFRQFSLEGVRARISAARVRLEAVTGAFESAESAARCCGSKQSEAPDVETLVAALPARLHALAYWHHDPVELLLDAGGAASRALLGLAATARDGKVANLAAVLLGIRQRASAGGQRGVKEPPEALPEGLHPAYWAGRSGPRFSPVMIALAVAGGRPLAELPSGIPELVASRLGPPAERVAVLYGLAATLEVLRSLTARWEKSGVPARSSRTAISRLKRLARAAETMAPITLRTALEERVVDDIRTLPRLHSTQAHVVVRLFKEWVEVNALEPRGVSSQQLRRIAYRSLALGPAAALEAMGKVWLAAGTETDRPLEAVGRAQLALSLTHPGMALAAPVWSSAERIDALRFVAARLDGPKLAALWPQISALGEDDLYRLPIEFLQSAPADLAGRALDLGVAEQAGELERPVLKRYLRTVSTLGAMQLHSLARQDWFLDLFKRGGAPAAALTLALVSSFGRREDLDGRLASLHALGQGFKSHGPLLERALRDWNATTVEAAPPELDALAEALEMSSERMRRYLHFKRLAGHGESFSNELLDLLDFDRKQESEIAYLEARVRAPDLPREERSLIDMRLVALKDPDSQGGRRRKALRRAHNRFERALALYRIQSLERTLTGVYCRLLSSLLGEKVPADAMRPGMMESLQLLSSDNRNWHLLVELLRDEVRGRPLQDRAANREWLTRAARAGLKVDVWLRGLRATVEIDGASIEFASERDPFEILKMGSYFDTCLSLEREDGALAASVVVNALDINKHVVYGRLPDGTVVARKLIGATAAGQLAGYNTYVSYNREPIAAALARLLEDFASSCGLRLSDTATPEVLHDGYWYDDGNEPWSEFAGPSQADPEEDLSS
jgi:hypothetical protein